MRHRHGFPGKVVGLVLARTNFTRIPNRHVWLLGNVIDNPRRQRDQLFSIAAPFSGPEQEGSGLGHVRADDDLHIAGNLIAGRGLPTGVDECAAADCGALAERNALSASSGLFRRPTRGDLRLRAGRRAPDPVLPSSTGQTAAVSSRRRPPSQSDINTSASLCSDACEPR